MPNGSVYPWVSAQCRLTYFNYGLRVCCAPWRIHGLGLTCKPKLSRGDFLFSVLHAEGELCPHSAQRAGTCLSPQADAAGLAVVTVSLCHPTCSNPDLEATAPSLQLPAWRSGCSSAFPGDVHQDLQHHPLIRMSLNSCHVALTFCHGWQRWD